MKSDIEAKRGELQIALASLGQRLDDGDESQLVVWVIPGVLACAHRPLRHHQLYGRKKKGRNLPRQASASVITWLQRIRDAGIRSVICLLPMTELKHYARLELGAENLIEFYRKADLVVEHVPWDDPAHRPDLDRPTYAQELARVRTQAIKAFDELPKPILMHCSAGIDRSSPVAAYIFCERKHESDT